MKQTIHLSDGQVYQTGESVEPPPPGSKPNPSARPLLAWFPGPLDRPFGLRHLGYTVGQLGYSNETTNALHGDNVASGKVNVPLGKRHEWQRRLEELNNLRLLGLILSAGFGVCDTGNDNDERIPYVTEDIAYGCSIDFGGNRRNCKDIIRKAGSKFAVFETQDWNGQPNPLITYKSHPHLIIKCIAASNPNHPGHPFWRTIEAGDVVLNLVSNVKFSHRLMDTHFYPGYTNLEVNEATGDFFEFEPFDCMLFGYRAHVIGYGITGSDTWVEVNGGELDSGWYMADGYLPPWPWPLPGNDKQYICNISGVSWPWLTPPVAGGRKE